MWPSPWCVLSPETILLKAEWVSECKGGLYPWQGRDLQLCPGRDILGSLIGEQANLALYSSFTDNEADTLTLTPMSYFSICSKVKRGIREVFLSPRSITIES